MPQATHSSQVAEIAGLEVRQDPHLPRPSSGHQTGKPCHTCAPRVIRIRVQVDVTPSTTFQMGETISARQSLNVQAAP
ncbi:hypothetical protein GCM10010844_12480 [Deinococcus radiotolerans]|uniref:Uncharacterized protein n=1 Tax=Deinococcus radiotolerans TaxID=1309407 RepID=A0ABQ2FIV0_9DEIO|nr:hypothetical protein GCM10010844_12480 [Deinococcus radiotolerans]